MVSVLFVCTGNICRSPTAEAVFRDIIGKKGLAGDVTHDSAGTHGYHIGEPADSRTIQVAESRGIRIADLRARKMSVKDFERFDYLVAMDEGHRQAMLRLAPEGMESKVSMLLDYHAKYAGQDVPDPYYGDMMDFEHTYDLIERGLEAFVSQVLKNPI